MNQNSYQNVDEAQAQTTLQDAAAKCNVVLDVYGQGRQVRLDCQFGCQGDHAGKRELSIDTGNPQKVFACHAYACQMRGNLLTLMHGWLTGTRPPADTLKGEDFKHVRGVLLGQSPSPSPGPAPNPAVGVEAPEQKAPPPRNVPLVRSDNEKTAGLVTLDEKFIRDVANMPPSR